jgi:hypothetical protein
MFGLSEQPSRLQGSAALGAESTPRKGQHRIPAGTPVRDRLAQDVIFVHDGERGCLLDLGGQFYALSALATRMLQLSLSQGRGTAVRSLAVEYGQPEAVVRGDLQAFLGKLQRQHLVAGTPPGRLAGVADLLAAVLVVPTLALVLGCLRSPYARATALLTLTRLSFPVFGWSRTVALWDGATRRHRSRVPAKTPAALARAVVSVVCRAAARHVLQTECKERALCCWALLRALGLRPDLVVGISLYPVQGHCWCQAGDLILGDHRERCETFTPVRHYH